MKFNTKKFKLSSHHWNRREFDASNPDDLAEYRHFLQTSHWKNGCPFILEWPFNNAISMIEHKIVSTHITKLIKTNTTA
jgi:hypothetical protein